jgi:CHAT domain-containing protein/Flp pilus assembly protein TadD
MIRIGYRAKQMGDYERATEVFRMVERLARQTNDQATVARARVNLGTVSFARGDYADAMGFYQTGLALSQQFGDQAGEGRALVYIGILYLQQGNYDQALRHCLRGLEFSEAAANEVMLSIGTIAVGDVYYQMGDLPHALEYYHKQIIAAQYLTAQPVEALQRIGLVHLRQGNYAEALRHLEASLVRSEWVKDHNSSAATLGYIGLTHLRQGDYRSALEYATRGASLANNINSPDNYWTARTIEAQAALALGQTERARQGLLDAIDSVEKLRLRVAGNEEARVHFFETKLAPYHALIAMLADEGRIEEAFLYADRAKAHTLLDSIRGERAQLVAGLTTKEVVEERRLMHQIVVLNQLLTSESQSRQSEAARVAGIKRRLHEARMEYESFETKIFAARPELRLRRGVVEPLTMVDVATLVPDRAHALLEYVVTDGRVFLFVLTRGDAAAAGNVELHMYPLAITPEELRARVRTYRQRLATADDDFRSASQGLYETLIAPARSQLQGIHTLIISPDATLWELPFQSLLTPDGSYLIEHAAISYAPSATVLRELMRARPTVLQPGREVRRELLALGNPTLPVAARQVRSLYRDEKLTPLPEAEIEVDALARLYGAAHSRAYTRARASESLLKREAGRYQVLHLATHGIVDQANPMYSHLILAQGTPHGGEDGLLEAWEIARLNLRAQLVVLSACETARGNFTAGEGTVGLAWAFFIAGAPTAVVSLWKVESKSTSELMVEFHRQWRAGRSSNGLPITKGEALRRAELKLLRKADSRHPFYWAGFVVLGTGT